VEKGRTIPVVPRMEIPPTMPSRSLDVLAAMSSPPGTDRTTSTARPVTSPTDARIMRAGTRLTAGAPTGRPNPGRVTVPTPGPARMATPALVPVGAHRTSAVTWARSVTSGSSPASLTTATR
jgi:hypothetical protein